MEGKRLLEIIHGELDGLYEILNSQEDRYKRMYDHLESRLDNYMTGTDQMFESHQLSIESIDDTINHHADMIDRNEGLISEVRTHLLETDDEKSPPGSPPGSPTFRRSDISFLERYGLSPP